ncbi:MAG: CIS tube protein [Albimonas sp.]|uniref:CIS tube protein n=1 Tax=Albimonas sp. TaxID=1872425 RepID=UPI00405608A1
MTDLALGKFRNLDGGAEQAVDFNPATLKVSLTNKLQEEGQGDGTAAQHTRSTTAKLEMELVFDSTEDGADVRDKTGAIKAMAVVAAANPTQPPRVSFTWGRFLFAGVIESLNETLEFWSAEGVPLRAAVQIVMQQVGEAEVGDQLAPDAPERAAVRTAPEGGFGVAQVASDAGDPGAGRRVAADNGLESMRLPGGGAVGVGGGVTLRAAAGFQASASVGAGISAGFGASAGAGFGASAGAGFGASAGGGFGASATAGVSFGVGARASGGVSGGFGAGGGIGAGAGFGAGAGGGFGASAGGGFGASAGGGFGASAGGGFGGSAGFGASAGGGFGGAAGGASAGAMFGGAGFGASASAGTSASAGAFSGLGASKTPVATTLDPARLLPPPPSGTAGFDVTGRATGGASSGLGAGIRRSVSFSTKG